MMKWKTALMLVVVALMVSGCFFTKVVTVPMRLGAAVISIIPVAGNTAHDAIDQAADVVDEVPI
ncbi:MAG: hypothetical protein RI601_00650 [Desulfurivibrionaceae bacterium]|nr:hypothetical protein [Desulfurivibrionaceae bacterium]